MSFNINKLCNLKMHWSLSWVLYFFKWSSIIVIKYWAMLQLLVSFWAHSYPSFRLLVISTLGFKATVDPSLHCPHAMDPSEPPLVWHPLTSSQPVSQPKPFWSMYFLHKQALVGLKLIMCGTICTPTIWATPVFTVHNDHWEYINKPRSLCCHW